MEAVAKSTQLKALFQRGHKRTYTKNELVVRADEIPQGVYMIESGLVKVYSVTRQHDEHVHHFFGPDDFFPIIWTFQGGLADMFCEALTTTTIWIVPRDTFMNFISHNNDVMLELIEQIVGRYHLYTGRIDNLLYSDARERSAYRLLSLANRFGVKTDEGLVIQAAITHEDLAHSINMTRETFGRTFGRLQEKGIITYDDQRRLVIKDLAGLVKITGRDETDGMWPKLTQYLS